MSKGIMALVILFLVVSLVACTTAAYWGYGARRIGPRHIRSGSLYGPSVSGGGPSAGK